MYRKAAMLRGAFGIAMFTLTTCLAQAPTLKVLRVPTAGDWSGRLASPDGRYVLYGVPFQQSVNDSPQLWLQYNPSGRKQLLLMLGRTISAQWAPDSSAFSINNEFASDTTDAFIYSVSSLQPMNVGEKILAAYPDTRRFTRGHAYFEVESWQDSKQVTVRFHGHTDESPVECFDSRYNVTVDGAVAKLSESSGPIGSVPCS